MSCFITNVVTIVFGITALALAAPSAQGQVFPAKPIRIIVPGGTGSSIDTAARELSQRLPALWGQPAIVEYKPGGGNSVGADYVAKSAPDGYTWLVAPYNVLTLNQHLYGNPVHPLAEFTPVTRVANVPFVFVVHPSLNVNSVAELIALARANPGKFNYGTTGVGSAPHIAAELFNAAAEIQTVGIAYKGVSNLITDLLTDRVQLYFGAVNSVLPHIQAGKLRALAAASARRGRITADLPTIAESGLPGYDVSTWNAIVLPAGVSTELVARIHTAVVGIFTTPEVRDRFAKQGIEVDPSSPADLAALIRSEYERYGQLVKRTGIKGERE